MDTEEEENPKPKRNRECVCPNCGYITRYRRGKDCYKRRCPGCGSNMMED